MKRQPVSKLTLALFAMALLLACGGGEPVTCTRDKDCPSGKVCQTKGSVCVSIASFECKRGERRDCYTGPSDTKGKGSCQGGSQWCDNAGQWGPCEQETLPVKEICGNGKDDNCDGIIDDPTTCQPTPCAIGETRCAQDCVNLQTDKQNCGSCGKQCASAVACKQGACDSCPAPAKTCNGQCTNVTSDPNNCGDCGVQCTNGKICSTGQCNCAPGKTDCGGQCVDTMTEILHCGGCNTKCPNGQVCQQGQCQLVCSAPTSLKCGELCVNPSTDTSHCGGCNKACQAGLSCLQGSCQKAPGPTTTPQRYKDHKGVAGYYAIGNTMMSASPPGHVNDVLLPQSSADFPPFPDTTIVAGYLFWSGSIDQKADNEIQFKTPTGNKLPLTADLCTTLPAWGGTFYCRKDITTLLKSEQKPGGMYTLYDLQAKPGDCQQAPAICQSNHAGWAMVVVYANQKSPNPGHVLLYDGYVHLDETPTQSGIITFKIDGFKIQDKRHAALTFFGLEGDRFLGAPPEPDHYGDFMEVQSNSATKSTRMESVGPYNPAGNLWNSTIGLGVDIDTFWIGPRIGLDVFQVGDTELTIRTGSGDGIVPGGNGESIYLGFVVLGVNL